jgi:hypothetical protein
MPHEARSNMIDPESRLPLVCHAPGYRYHTETPLAVFRIRIHFFESGSSILGWIPIRIQMQSGARVFMTKNWKKFTAEFLYIYFFIKNFDLLIPRPLKKTSKVKEKPSASKENNKHFKTRKFLFYTFMSNLCFPGSGSGFRIRIHGPDWIRSGFETLTIVDASVNFWTKIVSYLSRGTAGPTFMMSPIERARRNRGSYGSNAPGETGAPMGQTRPKKPGLLLVNHPSRGEPDLDLV